MCGGRYHRLITRHLWSWLIRLLKFPVEQGHKLMKLGQEIRVLGPKTRYSLKHPEETEKWDWPVLFS
ncbi:Ephrin Type-B Receptor 1 [Manis pentadactyla]|nr:Ephrin Type-B Receptor 1 [Manis pentadactyla]